MKFPFTVKHNGVIYAPGKNVPIGEEPKKENQVEDKTASELSKELKERFDITLAPQVGKAKLLEALAQAEKEALEAEEAQEEPENDEVIEGQLQLDLDEEGTDEEPEIEGSEEEAEESDETFLDKIINEE